MQQRRQLDEKQINRELLNGNLATPKWYYPVMGVLGVGVLIGFATILYMFNRGLGVTGLARPVYWGLFITTFVFWVGISPVSYTHLRAHETREDRGVRGVG